MTADLSHAGGIVIVPDTASDWPVSIYNFKELEGMEPKRLLGLGLPMPSAPTAMPLFRLFR